MAGRKISIDPIRLEFAANHIHFSITGVGNNRSKLLLLRRNNQKDLPLLLAMKIRLKPEQDFRKQGNVFLSGILNSGLLGVLKRQCITQDELEI